MLPRISQAAIAHPAGVHPTTVSISLRLNAAIPAVTRQRIQRIAAKLGFQPDAALRTPVAYRSSHTKIPGGNTLAYLTNWDKRWGWPSAPAHARFHTGVLRKADELGYQLEHFWLSEPGITHAQLSGLALRHVLAASYRRIGFVTVFARAVGSELRSL